jgi:hypothetical protein
MEQQVNLYQPILGAEKHLFSARAIGIALGALVISLGSLAAYAGWRNARLERTLSSLEHQQAAELAMSERANATLKPAKSITELDAEAKTLSADIASRERALDIVRRGAADPVAGFAARLEALARARVEGLWLRRVLVASGDSQLAFQGATVDAQLLPSYLAALSNERAFEGANLDRLTMQAAKAEDAPAVAVFEVGAPGLKFAKQEPGS